MASTIYGGRPGTYGPQAMLSEAEALWIAPTDGWFPEPEKDSR
jgi:hypothetical protein